MVSLYLSQIAGEPTTRHLRGADRPGVPRGLRARLDDDGDDDDDEDADQDAHTRVVSLVFYVLGGGGDAEGWRETSTTYPPGLHSLMHLDRVFVDHEPDGLEGE